MTLLEMKKHLKQVQISSTETVVNLLRLNRHAANMCCAIDNMDIEEISHAFKLFAETMSSVGDSLDEFCNVTAALGGEEELGGDEDEQG